MGMDRRLAQSAFSHWRAALLSGTALTALLVVTPAFAYDVFSEADLNAAIATARTTAGTEIVLKSNITLTADLAALQGTGTVIRSDTGQNYTIDGANTYRGFFVYSGDSTIQNLTIRNAVAQGGNGGNAAIAGGGGAGLGGALFVNAGAVATIANVILNDNAGRGGNGGSQNSSGGAGAGGGGMGGDGGGGLPGVGGSGGGGGLGRGGTGGNASGGPMDGSPGIVTGAAPAGNGSGGGLLVSAVPMVGVAAAAVPVVAAAVSEA